MDFPSLGFQTVGRLTAQPVPLLDYKTVGFQTVTEDEIHTQISKK